MAQVRIAMPALGPARAHPKMVLRMGKVRVVLPFAPTGYEARYGRSWQEVPRPVLKPVAVDSGGALTQVQYGFTVAYADGRRIGPVLRGLQQMAERRDGVLTIAGASGLEKGPWRLVDLRVRVTKRQQGTNAPLVADVELGLVEVTRVRARIGRSR
jgi:hypothetical protein